MGTATEQLIKEHQGIQLMLDIVDKVCEKIRSKEKIDSGHLNQILEFFQVFADQCHHGKEEEILFPTLEGAGIPKEGGPIGVMLSEHTQLREYVKAMAEAVDLYQRGEHGALMKFAENGAQYVGILRQHIDKEQNILFKMADSFLSDQQQQEIFEAFEELEEEKIGVGKHEEFHHLLDHLKDIYLKNGTKSI